MNNNLSSTSNSPSNKLPAEEDSCCSNTSCCSPQSTIKRDQPKIGRNETCPCGSERKYKKCCGK